MTSQRRETRLPQSFLNGFHPKNTIMLLIHRTTLRRRTTLTSAFLTCHFQLASFHNALHRAEKADPRLQSAQDPRIADLGHVIEDEYAVLRERYRVPKNPIILAHGLLGFDELHLAGQKLPGIHYWRGITEALAAKGVEVITATVPAAGSIEQRAEKLGECIERKAKGKSVNIIAYVAGWTTCMRADVLLTVTQAQHGTRKRVSVIQHWLTCA